MRHALAAALVAVAAFASSGGAAAAVRVVKIPGSFFSPAAINIVVDDTVRWRNDSFQDHNVKDTSHVPPAFQHPFDHVGDEWATPDGTFTTEEKVNYVCTIHASMKGSIAVWNVWLGKPATITYGKNAVFTGLAGKGATVSMVETAGGTTVGTSLPATDAGTWSASVPAVDALPGEYLANDGTNDSRTVRLDVRTKLTVTRSKVRAGVWNVTVVAAPDQAGAVAVLDRRRSTGWTKLASKTLGTRSRATFRVVIPKRRLTLRVRLTKPKNGYVGNTSAAFAITR